MLDDLDTFLEQLVRIELGLVDDEAAAFPDFPGLWHPLDYVIDTWMHYRRHGALPRAGAFNQQSPKWWADVKVVTLRYNAWFVHLSQEKQHGDPLKGLLNPSAPSWETLLGD